MEITRRSQLTDEPDNRDDDCKHEWVVEPIRDANFGVTFGNIRTCSICGLRQHADSTQGRSGGDWVVMKDKEI